MPNQTTFLVSLITDTEDPNELTLVADQIEQTLSQGGLDVTSVKPWAKHGSAMGVTLGAVPPRPPRLPDHLIQNPPTRLF